MKIDRFILADRLYNNENKYLIYDTYNKNIFKLDSNFVDKMLSNDGNIKDYCINHLKNIFPKKEVFNKVDIKHDSLNMVRILVTNKCNLRCRYCYADGGSYGKSCINMSKKIYIETCKYLTKYYNEIKEINFFGGEPCLNLDAIEYICMYFSNSDFINKPSFSLFTNGTICNQRLLNLINQYKISLIVSLDSINPEINDYNRFYESGRGTFDIIDSNLKKFVNHTDSNITIETTYTKKHVDYGVSFSDIMLDNYNRYGVRLNLIEEESGKDIGKIDLKNIDNSLKRDIDSFVDYGVSNSRVVSFINSIYAKDYYDLFCDALFGQIAIDPFGNIYPCQMFVATNISKDLESFSIGNVVDGEHNREYVENWFLENNKKNLKTCSKCTMKSTCRKCPFSIYFEKTIKKDCGVNFENYFSNINYFINLISDRRNEEKIRENVKLLSKVYRNIRSKS